MSFKDMVKADIHKTFLNTAEFGEIRTIIYDDVTYEDVSVVITGVKEKDRRVLVSDHVQGLYLVSCVLHCSLDDVGGILPEKGKRIKVSKTEGSKFFREYRIGKSFLEMGMLRLELEAVDE